MEKVIESLLEQIQSYLRTAHPNKELKSKFKTVERALQKQLEKQKEVNSSNTLLIN